MCIGRAVPKELGIAFKRIRGNQLGKGELNINYFFMSPRFFLDFASVGLGICVFKQSPYMILTYPVWPRS